MQHTIYLLKNGLVVQLDWHCCITVGAVIFLFVHIFLIYIVHNVDAAHYIFPAEWTGDQI